MTQARVSSTPVVSVVVPMHDEEGNIRPLVERILRALDSAVPSFEIVLVDDGSKDGTRAEAMDTARQDQRVRILAHPIAAGQSAAVHSGVVFARGGVVATLDADGQNPPEDLPKVLSPLLSSTRPETLAIVAGQRVGRKDTVSKRLASRFANAVRSRVLNDRTRDTGCGLKAFDRAAYLALPFFNHQHRYLPALFARDGWSIAHVDVSHAPRVAGRSKYNNLQRGIVGITDLLGVAWLIRRRKRAKATEVTVGKETT